jgi:hypothetical protein
MTDKSGGIPINVNDEIKISLAKKTAKVIRLLDRAR